MNLLSISKYSTKKFIGQDLISYFGNWWCIDTTESRRTRSARDKRLLVKILGILFVLFWLYILGSWIFAQLVLGMTKISYLDSARFHQGQTVQVWVFKNEHLLYPRSDGTVSFAVQEGSRVRPNQPLGSVAFADGSTQTLQINSSGLFSQKIDGLESTLENYDKLSSLNKKSQEVSPKAVCKVVDNLSPVQFYFEIEQTDSWKISDPISLIWQGAEPQGKGMLAQYLPEEVALTGKVIWMSENGLLVEVDDCPDQLLLTRQTSLFLSTKELSGYLVSKSALTEPKEAGGQKSLYYVRRGQAKLEQVQVIANLEDQYLINSPNLSDKTRYVNNARWIKEGEKLE